MTEVVAQQAVAAIVVHGRAALVVARPQWYTSVHYLSIVPYNFYKTVSQGPRRDGHQLAWNALQLRGQMLYSR